MHTSQWIVWARELQSIAQAGLQYSRDPFDIERFERIRDISAEMVSFGADMPLEKVKNIFCCEKGYQTPKVDVRAAIIEKGKILLVRENDGRWSMPGGWADVGLSAAENAVKESLEEAGASVKPRELIAFVDWEKNNSRGCSSILSIYKAFVLCDYICGGFADNIETTASAWFSPDELPELSYEKNSPEQIKMCFEAAKSENWKTVFD